MPAKPTSPSLNFPTASNPLADAHHPAPTTAIANGWRLVSFDLDFERPSLAYANPLAVS